MFFCGYGFLGGFKFNDFDVTDCLRVSFLMILLFVRKFQLILGVNLVYRERHFFLIFFVSVFKSPIYSHLRIHQKNIDVSDISTLKIDCLIDVSSKNHQRIMNESALFHQYFRDHDNYCFYASISSMFHQCCIDFASLCL